MIGTVRLVLLSAHRAALEQWTWRSFMVTLMLGQAVGPVIGFLVWRAVAPSSVELTGYFAALLVTSLCTVSYEDHTLASAIHSGSLTSELLQPQPILLPFIGTNIALRFWHILFGLPIVGTVVLASGGGLSLNRLAAAVPALVLAGALRFLITTTLALSAFWIDDASSVVGVGNVMAGLLGGLAAPLFLLPSPWQEIGHAIPFWAMVGMPAELITGTLSGRSRTLAYASQLAWLAAAALAARVVWHRGLRRFSAFGA